MAFRRRAKSHPLFSQEFLIHNHADIGFCLVLSVLIALMFEVRTTTLPPPPPCHPIQSPSLSTLGSPLAEIPIRIPTYVLALGASHPFASPNPSEVHQMQKSLKLGECTQILVLLYVPPDLPPLLGMGNRSPTPHGE
uniref:Uncharacterized protein n=1 Tax=Meleagris gallopavo TaxID=9103 RepID=A0A803XSE7_MELGA